MVTSLPLISEGASSEMYLSPSGQRRRRMQGEEKKAALLTMEKPDSQLRQPNRQHSAQISSLQPIP